MRPKQAGRFSTGWPILIGACWIVAVLAGFAVLLDYEWKSGPATSAPLVWPETSQLELDERRPTLVLFAHPHCPCTLATLEELDRIAAHCRERVRVAVFVVDAATAAEDPSEENAWERAARIPGVEVREDRGGSIAQSFHAATSGHAFLFAPDGRLLFDGGITGSRGHVGDNAGASAVIAWVIEGASPIARTSVFGCPLSPSSAPEPDQELQDVSGSS